MKYLKIFLLIFVSFFCSGYSEDIIALSVDRLEKFFSSSFPVRQGVYYTKVPRGLIISVDENLFFNDCNFELKDGAYYILDEFADLLKTLPNFCVIENHVQKEPCGLENWELSMMRSSSIAEYLVKEKNVPSEKIFDIGFGETMPFRDNVAPKDGLDNRVDFVIIEYEAKR